MLTSTPMTPQQGGARTVSADDFRRYFWTVSVLRAVAIAFVVAVMIAMLCYPGGNIHNPDQIGYSFTHNFFSDLGGYTAHSGALNFFSAFFFNGGLFLFIGVGVSFLFVPRLFRADAINFRLAWLGSIFFLIGTLFFASVGLTPRDLYIDPHLFFALNAFRLMVPATLLYFIVILRSPIEKKYALVTLMYLCAVVGYVIFQLSATNAMESEAAMVTQVTMQKLIVFASVANIFALSFAFASQWTHNQLQADAAN